MHALSLAGSIGAVLFFLFQAALIVGWLANRAKRRQGEAEATLIADISSKFVNLAPAEVDREIMDAERRICELLDLDISAIWQWSAGHPGYFTLSHYVSAQDGPQPSMQLSDTDFPWFRQLMLDGRCVPISSLDDMPAEAALDRENCRRLGIKSNLCIPLMVGGEPVGILGLNTVRAERKWPDPQVKRLQLIAQIFTNALARKRADQALRESEERLTLAAEAAEVGVWEWHIGSNKVWGSDRWLRLLGFAAAEDASFEMVLERIHPDDRRSVERKVRHALACGTDFVGEFRTVMPDGTQRWIASRGLGQPGSNGTLDRMLGAAIDITERKRAEEALRKSEARLAAGVELAGLGYFEVDYDERTGFMDEQFRKICGVPADRQQGWQSVEFWLEHVHPDDLQPLQDERRKLHDGTIDEITAVYRYLHPTHGQKWLHHLARIAGRSADGAGITTYGVVRDITELKRAEEAALDFSGRLLHAQEAERARIAKELHDGLSQNLALFSVELDMFGQRLPDTAAQINARLGEFSRQTKGLSAEVHRIAHGLHPAKLTQLGLAVALNGFCREMEAAHGISVSFQTHEVPRELPEDVALCLYRVTQEAIHNVAKHSGARHAQVELAAVNDALALTITDDGKGFVMEAERTTGSLGLVSMHERVRLVGGEIAVKSQPAEGTCVEVRVPFKG